MCRAVHFLTRWNRGVLEARLGTHPSRQIALLAVVRGRYRSIVECIDLGFAQRCRPKAKFVHRSFPGIAALVNGIVERFVVFDARTVQRARASSSVDADPHLTFATEHDDVVPLPLTNRDARI